MSEELESQPSPTIADPSVIKPVEEPQEDSNTTVEINKDIQAKAESLQTIGSFCKKTLTGLTGLIGNIASVGIDEKVDYDKNGKQIVDGIGLYKKRYRSSQNFSENEDIAKAIEQQKQELKEAREAKAWTGLEFINENDILSIIDETNAELQARIFGPMWNNWTNGKDFINDLKNTLENLIDTFDPLMELVDQLQDYINDSVGEALEDITIDTYTSRRTGQTNSIPIGMIALQALNTLIDYIRSLIENLEYIAEQYTVEELNVLLRRGTSGSNYGTLIKTIQDLIQMIINAIKPYIHNLIMALILDAIDFIVDILDKAGILSPKGPLKLIPIAITLARAILKGDLEAIEEMVKQSITKIINLIQLAGIAIRDPSILWADTDRLDKEIAVARYEELTADGKFSKKDKDKFLNYTDTSYTAGARHFLQKMKGETQETFNQIADLATTYTDLNLLYKNAVASNKAIKENKKLTEQKLKEESARMTVYESSIDKEVEEINYP